MLAIVAILAYCAVSARAGAQGLEPRGAVVEVAHVTGGADQPLPAWMALEDAGASMLWVQFSGQSLATRVILHHDGRTIAIDAPGACVGKPAAVHLGDDRIALALVCDSADGERRRSRAFVLMLEEKSSLRRWQAVSEGAAVAAEGEVDLATCSSQLLVVWRTHSGDGDILGRIFDSTAHALTPVLRIGVAPAGATPRVACGAGRFVVVWGERSVVWSQAVGFDGSLLGDAVQVSPASASDEEEQSLPVVAMNDGGDAVVAWRTHTGALYGRVYRPDGAPAGSAIRISSMTRALRGELQAAIDSHGQLAFVWQVLEGGGLATFGRIFTGERHLPVEAESRFDRGRESGFVGVRVQRDGEFLVSWREATPSEFVFAARRLNVGLLASEPRTVDEVRCRGRQLSLALAHLRPDAARESGGIVLWPAVVGESGIWFRRSIAETHVGGQPGSQAAPAGIPFAVGVRSGDRLVQRVDGDSNELRWIAAPDSTSVTGSPVAGRKERSAGDCGAAPSAADAERAAWVAQRLRSVGEAPLTGLSVYRGEGVDTFVAELFVLPAKEGLGSVHVAAEIRLRCNRRGEPAAVEVRLYGNGCSESEHQLCSDTSASVGLGWGDEVSGTTSTPAILRPGRPESGELFLGLSASAAPSASDTSFAEFCPAAAVWSGIPAN